MIAGRYGSGGEQPVRPVDAQLVVVISERLWGRIFGNDLRANGERITVCVTDVAITGIAAASPDGLDPKSLTDLYLPISVGRMMWATRCYSARTESGWSPCRRRHSRAGQSRAARAVARRSGEHDGDLTGERAAHATVAATRSGVNGPPGLAAATPVWTGTSRELTTRRRQRLRSPASRWRDSHFQTGMLSVNRWESASTGDTQDRDHRGCADARMGASATRT